MAPDDSSARPDPVVLRIKLRYADLETFTERFAPHVGRSGLFLPTRAVQPLGAEVKFELRLADDRPVLLGMGRVRSAVAPDPAQPKAAFGLSVELTRVTRESRERILQLLARRRQLGLAETDLPQASDIDAAKQARAATPVPPEAAAPEAAAPEEAAPEAAAPEAAAPEVVSPAAAVSEPPPPLAPEPKRRPRTAVSELIAQASSGPVAMALPALDVDGDVDVGAAILRARAITSGDFDRELESLFEQAFDQSPAPIVEISVEAASAELARQLGGVAVRKESSPRWSPPPAVTSEPLPAPEEDVEAAPVAAEAPPVAAEAPPAAEAAEPIVEEPVSVATAETIDAEIRAESQAELHHVSESDYDEGEHTAVGAQPSDSGTFDDTLLAMHLATEAATEPAGGRVTAAALERAPTPDPALDDTVTPSPDEIEEVQDFEILSEADLDDPALIAVQGDAAGEDHQAGPPVPAETERWASFADFAARLDLDDESDLYPRAPQPVDDMRELDSRPLSVSRALASLESDDADDRSAYVDPIDFDGRHAPFSLADAFDASDSNPQAELDSDDSVTHARSDLETALEALDVDLDDLSLPHGPGPLPVSPRELSARRRAVRAGDDVEDSVEIEFDDD